MASQAQTHRLRSGRHSQSGQIYMLTTVTKNRATVFDDFTSARKLIGVLRDQQRMQQAMTLAFVVMPDHLHWLMALGDKVPLSVCMRNVKTLSALRVGRPIWQAGFHDHAVRREEDLPSLARYVVSNPVRAGLVVKTGQYAHWDAVWV